MEKQRVKQRLPVILAGIFSAAVSMTALADNNGVNGGTWTDGENLTWETNDGTVTTFGRGPVFADEHPEITDPEYFLKEPITYPVEVLQELRKFVSSFDWIHSDELTRVQMVHDRISNGCGPDNRNRYELDIDTPHFSVLLNGKGICKDFAAEFANLCKYVGVECVTYEPSFLHEACLVKIGDQWLATDPTDSTPFFLSNGKTYPVDFETEYNRYANEVQTEIDEADAGLTDDLQSLGLALTFKMTSGEITAEEYEREMQKLFGN